MKVILLYVHDLCMKKKFVDGCSSVRVYGLCEIWGSSALWPCSRASSLLRAVRLAIFYRHIAELAGGVVGDRSHVYLLVLIFSDHSLLSSAASSLLSRSHFTGLRSVLDVCRKAVDS